MSIDYTSVQRAVSMDGQGNTDFIPNVDVQSITRIAKSKRAISKTIRVFGHFAHYHELAGDGLQFCFPCGLTLTRNGPLDDRGRARFVFMWPVSEEITERVAIVLYALNHRRTRRAAA